MNRAIRSISAQTRPPEELVVEHDLGRTGAAQTRNRALARVNTDVVMWLDDDDELMPNHVEVLAGELERRRHVDLVYPTPRVVGGADPTAVSVDGVWRLPWGVRFGPEQERHLRRMGSFIPITHAVRTHVVRRARGFPIPNTPEWPRPEVEDWGYLIRLLDAGARFHHVNVPTWVWHIHDAHTGGRPDRDR